MNFLADVAPPEPIVNFRLVACSGLACLFIVSAIVLAIVLARRSRNG